MIQLRTLGVAEIQTSKLTITPSQEIVFAAALYLLLESNLPVSRKRLASLLWPCVSQKVSCHRLRQTLFQLKRFGIEFSATRVTVQVPLKNVAIDLYGDFPTKESAGSPARLEILPGYDPSFSPAYAEWLDAARGRARIQLLERLIPQLEQARQEGDWGSVNRLGAYCLDLDSYNETALLARAEAFAMRGQKNAALDLLDQYVQEIAPRDVNVVLPAKILRNRVSKTTLTKVARPLAREPECVGRQAETLSLTNLLANSRSGNGAACLIKGDPGIGKTRLASELAKFAVLQGVGVERVACRKSEVDQPLAAFVALVPRLRDLPGALGVNQQSLHTLRRLTDFNPEAVREEPDEHPTSIYAALRTAILDLLDAVSEERPLLIVIDDIQWLDTASRRLFAGMLDWLTTRRLFLLFNSRSHSPLEDCSPLGTLRTIELKPLKEKEVAEVVSEIVSLSGVEITPNELEWLIRTSDGNPYFAQELAKHWIETGRGREIPASVVGVLDERISRLTAPGRQLLQAAALLSEHASLERLEQVLDFRPYELLAGLEELASAGMVRLGTTLDGPRQILQVRHDLLANAALNKLSPASTAFLHRRCGVVLESDVLGPSSSISLLRACAFHWQQAGDATRAYELSIKCANYLLEVGLGADATAALESVLAFCATSEQQIKVLEHIVNAHRMSRDSISLLNTIERVRGLQGLDSALQNHDDLEITEFEARRVSDSAIKPLFDRTLDCTYNKGLNPSHRVSVAVVALKLATALADLDEIERIYLEVCGFLGDESIDPRTRIQVQVIYHTMVGNLRNAVQFAKERISMERQVGNWVQVATAIADLVYVLRLAGPFEEIPGLLEEAYALAVSRKLFGAARDYAARLCAVLVELRRPDALLWLQRAKESHGETAQLQIAFTAAVSTARLALVEGQISEAAGLLNALPWEWLADRHGSRMAAIAVRARIRMGMNAYEAELLKDIDEMQALYPRVSRIGGQDYEVSSLCLSLMYVGRASDARKYLTDYVSSKRREIVPVSRDLEEVALLLAVGPQTAQLEEVPTSVG